MKSKIQNNFTKKVDLMNIPNIERLVNLREGLEVYYVVDGYVATFTTAEGDQDVIDGEGQTIQAALEDLDKKLEGKTLEHIRA